MISIRQPVIEDLPWIVAVYNSIVPGRMVTADVEPVSVSEKKEWFHSHSPTRPIWIIQNEAGKDIGWASFRNFYGRPAYNGTAEFSLYMDASFRNKGYGLEILKKAMATASALEIHTLLGFIFKHNLPSISLFKKAGFQEWGLLPDIAVMDQQRYSLIIMGWQTKQLNQ